MGFAMDGDYAQVALSKAPNEVATGSEGLVLYVATTLNNGLTHGLTLAAGARTPREALARLSAQIGNVKVVSLARVDLDVYDRALPPEKAEAHWIGERLNATED